MAGLESMIASLRSLERLPERAAAIAAPKIEEALRASASSGESPDGAAWAERKAGGRAMAGAAKAVSAKAFGPVVSVTLSGPEVFHHYGTRGQPRRQVIPDAGTRPAVVDAAIARAVDQAFAELAGGP